MELVLYPLPLSSKNNAFVVKLQMGNREKVRLYRLDSNNIKGQAVKSEPDITIPAVSAFSTLKTLPTDKTIRRGHAIP